MDEIIRWKPFLAMHESWDNSGEVAVTFRCPNCGGKNCDRRTKRTRNRVNDRHFWQGSYRCSDCGLEEDKDGGSLYYASDCFISTRAEVIIQQSLFD